MANHSPRQRWLRQRLYYPVQAFFVFLIFSFFRFLSPERASAVGGRLASWIGPRLGKSRKALRHLALALPELPPERHREILHGMWENLGRVFAEMPHLDSLWNETPRRIEMVGAEYFDLIRHSGRPALLISGHLANWELLGGGAAHHGCPITTIYRRPNNPYVDALLLRGRQASQVRLVPKGREGGMALVSTLIKKGTIGLLIDQKLNDGIPVPFFGHPCMTTPAPAQLALRYQCLVFPVRVERLEGTYFRITVCPPLPLPNTGDVQADIFHLTRTFNQLLEAWIRERPEQWLWLHRRWPE
jgi:KDO2-lipid IV(A) lauroyltransferase